MKLRILLTAVIFITLAVSPLLYAAEGGAVITSVTGDPKIMKKGLDSWVSCAPDTLLDTGDRVKTASGEDVQVSFADNSNFIKISENSDVVLLIGSNSGSIDLLSGEAMALVEKLPEGSTFEIKTPSGVSGARGTGWGSKTDGTRTTFNSYERSIYVKGIDNAGNVMKDELTVNEGLRTTVDRFKAPKTLERMSARDMDRWNGWKESLREAPSRQREASSKGTPSPAKEAVTRDKADKEMAKDNVERAALRGKMAGTERIARNAERCGERAQSRDTRKMDRRLERREPIREPIFPKPPDENSIQDGPR